MDIASITAALTGIKTATDIAKSLKEIDIGLEKAELKLQIAELISSLADSKISLVEIQEIIIEKEKEIQSLKESMDTKHSYVRKHEAYYLIGENGSPTGEPNCPLCFEVKHMAIHLVRCTKSHRVSVCPHCKNEFTRKSAL